jgi:1-acyl-sn-glycerol-3-phosphate acyltransferase
MLKKLDLNMAWRRLATGFCFLTFICGSFILTILVLPIILLFSSPPEQTEGRVLRLIRFCFKLFMQYMQVLKPIKAFHIEGLEHAESLRGCIFIANHPTLIDVVAVLSCLPPSQCIVKKSLLDHFYLGRIMRAAGYIANDHATQLMQDCQRSLHSGRSLLIFPEGTRSPAYGLNAFSRGAAQIALRTGAPVVPIVITCDPPTLLKGDPWYAVPPDPVTFTLRFFAPLSIPQTVVDREGIPLQVRALTRYFEDFFRHQLRQIADQPTAPYAPSSQWTPDSG